VNVFRNVQWSIQLGTESNRPERRVRLLANSFAFAQFGTSGDRHHLLMLRPKRFTPAETILLWIFAALLAAAGATGLLLSAGRAQWTLALASSGVLGIAALYFFAARRGRPI
jgi:hypothetical protein